VALRPRWLTRNLGGVDLNPELTVGDLTLRPRWLLARRGGHQIQRTNSHCAVLRLLMQNPRTVVRKDEILDHVWPDTRSRGGNNVKLHVSSLRQKINPACPHDPHPPRHRLRDQRRNGPVS
jgi:DNA-binding response OmpR family regulator